MFEVRTDDQTRLRWADPPEGAGNLHWGLTWISDTERFAVAEWAGHYPNYSAIITLRDAATGRIIETCERSGLLNDELATYRDGTLIAMAKATISAWQQSDLTRSPHVIHNDNRKHFTGIAFHPSGKYLAATSNDATVKLYDTTTWKVARTFTWDIGKMRSIAFSSDGTLAAAGSDSGRVVVWDVDL
jgi:WD40 repeat protein